MKKINFETVVKNVECGKLLNEFSRVYEIEYYVTPTGKIVKHDLQLDETESTTINDIILYYINTYENKIAYEDKHSNVFKRFKNYINVLRLGLLQIDNEYYPHEYLKMKTLEIISVGNMTFNRKTERIAIGNVDADGCVEVAELYNGEWDVYVVGIDEFKL